MIMGPNYLLVCFLLWEWEFPFAENTTNTPRNFTNTISENWISEKIQIGNNSEDLKLLFSSDDNSTVNTKQSFDKDKNASDTEIDGNQHYFVTGFINSSTTKIKYNNGTKSNLQKMLSDRFTNTSKLIELISSPDDKLMKNQTAKNVLAITNTSFNHENNQKGNVTTYKIDENTSIPLDRLTISPANVSKIKPHNNKNMIHSWSKSKHKIFKHFNLVPIEDEPFGSVLWKSNSKYLMSVCIPIGVGVAGAACIMGMAYAARRCYKNERKIAEIRAALQAQISANSNDQAVLLESSEEES